MGASLREIKKFYKNFHSRSNTNLINQIMERERYNFLRRMLTDLFNKKFLIVGCGSKDEMSIIPSNCTAIGMDISQEAIRKSQNKYPRFKYSVADVTKLPFKADEFDVVVCSEVIEHVSDERKALLEIKRVLKNNGLFILTTPNWWSWYGLLRKVGESILKRPFTSDNQPIDNWTTWPRLKAKLKRFNFNIIFFRGLWFFPPTGRGRFRIPSFIVLPFFVLFYPFEIIFRFLIPWFGHMLIIKSEVTK